MKLERSEANNMKFQALKWLRLDQRCMFIATEVGQYSADVLGVNEKKLIEVEVKCTFADFKNDFKKYKHMKYSQYFSETSDQWVPTHFYFAVPKNLVEKVKEYLAKESERYEKVACYGVIDCTDWSVVKRAQWLHKREPSNRVKCTTALRMGSELIRFWEAWL